MSPKGKVKGRKRHILVDTMGLLLTVVVDAASVQDRDGAKNVLAVTSWKPRELLTVRADGGCGGKLVGWCREKVGWALEVIRRPKDQRGLS